MRLLATMCVFAITLINIGRVYTISTYEFVVECACCYPL